MTKARVMDELSVERTRLANERTLLSYIRTALALAAGGAVLIEFFPDDGFLLGIAWGLLTASAITTVVGAYRFLVVAKKLQRA